MSEEESEKNYRSGLPGVLGVIDTAISKIESVILAMGGFANGAEYGHQRRCPLRVRQ